MTVLPITLTTAGATALITLWISGRTGTFRRRFKVSVGDGGEEALLRRMRAHANLTEIAPFFLILLGLVELADGTRTWLWLVSVAFILGRVLHVLGMDRPSPSPMRTAGFSISALALLGLALYAIVIPYLRGQPVATITYAAADQPRASAASATNGFVRLS
jgi:uncharacterized protein